MPDQRMIHPRLGHSDKVTALTDFEYRVWTQYLLSADDFGVMRFSAITIQSDNDSLHERSLHRVTKALDKLVECGLLHTYGHQARTYVCQLDWVHYQGVEYPRATMHPPPPAELVSRMEKSTQTLFAKHPGGVGRPKKDKTTAAPSPNISVTVSEPFPNRTQTEKELARARPRETLTLTQTPTQAQTQTQCSSFSERYGAIYAKVRRGAHYHVKPARDGPAFVALEQGWPGERLDTMLEMWLQMPAKDGNNVPGTPGQFLHMAPHCDRLLREHGR